MKRKRGYYWVRINQKVMRTLDDSWIFGYWNGDKWFLPGFFSELWDEMFIEIDETPLTR